MSAYWRIFTFVTLLSLVQGTFIITISGNTTTENGTTSTISIGLGTLLATYVNTIAALSNQGQLAMNASLGVAANSSQIIQEAISNITAAKISLLNTALQTKIATGGTIFNTGLRLAALFPRIGFAFGR